MTSARSSCWCCQHQWKQNNYRLTSRLLRNRGPQPKDGFLFGPKFHAALRAATDDLSWLLGRGYGVGAALQLVGNRYRLNKRQRQAVGRVAASPAAINARKAREVPLSALAGRQVAIDGFNLLILLESAGGGSIILRGRDGALRDLASVHGTYKHVRQTIPALERVGAVLRPAARVCWYFDAPVSNSGRLKTMLRELAEANDFRWTVELVNNPDRTLMALDDEQVIISSDSWILDEGGHWCNLGGALLEGEVAILEL